MSERQEVNLGLVREIEALGLRWRDWRQGERRQRQAVETLCSHPASSSHRQFGDAELAEAGLSPGMIRVSIGLEDPEDLVADLANAASGAAT